MQMDTPVNLRVPQRLNAALVREARRRCLHKSALVRQILAAALLNETADQANFGEQTRPAASNAPGNSRGA
jgi:hypothetical protein